MKKIKKGVRILLIFSIIFVLLLSLLLYKEYYPVYSKAIRNNGKKVENSIALVEKVTLGNMEQWIQIRGHSKNNIFRLMGE